MFREYPLSGVCPKNIYLSLGLNRILIINPAAIAAVMLVICRNKRRGDDITPTAKTAWRWIIPLIAGLSFTFPHSINLYLSGVMEAAIMFPVVNLGPLVLTTVAAAVIFKEKLSVRQWIGICIGIVSTLFVSGVIAF